MYNTEIEAGEEEKCSLTFENQLVRSDERRGRITGDRAHTQSGNQY